MIWEIQHVLNARLKHKNSQKIGMYLSGTALPSMCKALVLIPSTEKIKKVVS
jgi:hypothetical protein